MGVPFEGHPGVREFVVVRRAWHCPRCEPEHGPDWTWFGGWRWAVPLADGVTIVCRDHATDEEQRGRWCERCRRVLDVDEFDRVGPGRWAATRRACRACRATPRTTTASLEPRSCERCDVEFVPARADARYCSARCRTAAWRERKGS